MILLALFELVGVASVLPFMALLADPAQVSEQDLLRVIYEWGDFSDQRSFLIFIGIVVILLLAISRVLAVAVNYWRERFQWGVYERTSSRLLSYYVDQPYRYFLERNTAELRGYILNEVMVIVTACLAPVISLMISGGTALVIVLLLLVVSPGVALVSAAVFGGAYLLIYQLRKRPLARLGKARMKAAQSRYRSLEEMLQGIKTVKTYGNEAHFLQRYRRDTAILADVHPKLRIIFQTPKYVLEILAFCGIIGLTLILYLRSEDIGSVLPTLTLFAVAGYRLLPALQEIFGAYAVMRANRNVLEELYPDLRASLEYHNRQVPETTALPFLREVRVEKLSFRFPRAEQPLFQDLSLRIGRGERVAFVGATGSGKTTLADLLTGLLEAESGNILVDDTPLTPTNIPSWRRQLAYVPQDVFLYDATLRENISFGHPESVTDNTILDILQKVDLAEFVQEEAPAGLDTLLGENGVRLSGGQRQRVGLARALLRQPTVLVLDEATSALDTLTERTIIHALEKLPEELTVILIAHRLSTVRYADRIYLLEAGQILATGTYEELERDNLRFREMAALSRR